MRRLVLSRTTWLFFVIVWLAWACFTTRYAMLDDALIHLRYAEFLRSTHLITYDGVHPDYGTSSLLYVSLLAFLRGLTTSPLLPKIVSICAYFGLLASLWSISCRLKTSVWAKRLSVALLIGFLTPMAIRWLTDGMETSLTLLLITWVAILSHKIARAQTTSAWGWFALPVVGAALVLMRIELVMLACLVGLLLCGPQILFSSASRGQAVGRALALLTGTVIVMAVITLRFGHLLPDTALAKSGRPSIVPIFGVIHVTISSFMLGIGTTIIAIASAVIVLRKMTQRGVSKDRFFSWAIANASYWIILVLACVRGQAIQGIRYILWPLVFSSVWNILELEELEREYPAPAPASRSITAFTYAYVLLAILIIPMDAWYGFHAMMGRSKTFLQMRNSGLASLRGETIVAGDVGFISYFSQGNICDVDGLVNGRAVAALPPDLRYQRCAEAKPKALFLTSNQLRSLSSHLSLDDWSQCAVIDFQNVNSHDRHYLMLKKTDQSQLCAEVHQRDAHASGEE
ncbi:hypothetical protein [Edaphobacter sp. 12200R-103]|jgi:hypothetical protein|uniref:hypothetical protein n=1 Tax=Edaphobacter sp. 12200R-103 TaxID=2703788 RepID=UPI00138CF5D9|nr:hypothetical protein [Edaphobacter sp. 12200R-103]QHS50756.1 hypothetical protein GWR55_02585 [Edaphobacter sp. 12200R-103]